MAAFLDNCRFIPSTAGTTDWIFASAVGGCQSPALAGAADGRKYKFIAISSDLTQWEIAEGVYTAATGTFARTTVLYNSSGTGVAPGQGGGGSKINFAATPNVAIVAVKEDLISLDEANAFTAAQMAQARANIGVTKRNYIVNGGMMVSQENGSTAGTTSGYYPVDQWFMSSSASGTLSVSQVASLTPGGSPNRVRVTVTAADTTVNAGDYLGLVQFIEGLRVADLKAGSASAKTVTVQFGCKGPAGTYGVAIRNGNGSRSYISEFTISAGEANTDVVKSVTIPFDTTSTWATDNTAGMILNISLMVGSTYQTTAGSWAAGNFLGTSNQFNFEGTAGNVFELFDVGLYEGVAPPFQLPDYASEVMTCRRYFETSYAPGAIATAVFAGACQGAAYAGAVTQFVWQTPFPTRKRVAPTVSVYSANSGTVARLYDNTTGDRTATVDNISDFSFRVSSALGTGTVNMYWHWVANARM